MRIIGHDPYITRDRLSGLPVGELLPSTTCSPAPDYVLVHVPTSE